MVSNGLSLKRGFFSGRSCCCPSEAGSCFAAIGFAIGNGKGDADDIGVIERRLAAQLVKHAHDIERDDRIEDAADRQPVETGDGVTAVTAFDRVVDEGPPLPRIVDVRRWRRRDGRDW
jgi:hypothetical protein